MGDRVLARGDVAEMLERGEALRALHLLDVGKVSSAEWEAGWDLYRERRPRRRCFWLAYLLGALAGILPWAAVWAIEWLARGR